MSSEISTHILEYLKLFNSRSSQLILGAGATKSAGLKNITTKHLALASQSLRFVVTLVPYVREFVRRRGGNVASGVMGEFDRVKRLLQEHQAGIHDKLVDIMSGRAAAHINSMKRLDWNRAASAASDKEAGEAGEDVNEYMKTLVKETSTLHKVLGKHLPEGTVQMIMAPVMESYREQWGKAYGEVGLGTAVAKERLGRLMVLCVVQC
jgi:vacuolar protein sorting-associated protein 54